MMDATDRSDAIVIGASLAGQMSHGVGSRTGATLIPGRDSSKGATCPHTFKRLERVNVIPDAQERLAEIAADPQATFYFDNIRNLVGEGHNQYVDTASPPRTASSSTSRGRASPTWWRST
jgi:hypothetical protein